MISRLTRIDAKLKMKMVILSYLKMMKIQVILKMLKLIRRPMTVTTQKMKQMTKIPKRRTQFENTNLITTETLA